MGLTCPAPARLLDDEVVLDVRHTGDGGGVFPCSGFLLRSVDKAAQLHDSLEGLDLDLGRLHRVVTHKGALHLGCDDRIVHVFTSAFARGRRRAAAGEAADRERARQAE